MPRWWRVMVSGTAGNRVRARFCPPARYAYRWPGPFPRPSDRRRSREGRGKSATPLGTRLELGKGDGVEPLFLGQDRQEIEARHEAYHEAGVKFRRAEQNDVAAGEIEKGLDNKRISCWIRGNCRWNGVVPAFGRTIAKVMCDGQGLRHRAASQSRASPVWT